MNRLAILIDGNNFYKGCQLNFNRTDVDFRKLGQKLAKALDADLLRIYYYNAHVSPKIDPLGYQRQQKFFDNLRATPFITLKLGHLVYHRIRSEQQISNQFFPTEKGIDVQIAVDMIRLGLLKACDGIVLVSGDSDYIYAVRFAKDLGSKLYIASFPQGGSNELRNEGDGHVVMDYEFVQECFIRPTPYQRHESMPTISSVPSYRQQNYGQQNESYDRFMPDRAPSQNKYDMKPDDFVLPPLPPDDPPIETKDDQKDEPTEEVSPETDDNKTE
ncbi:MAG: NYN domain-containing protein [Calditrichaeota bacterium]|nr:NYN domain-containing protein [Calditrichota bacterium]